MVGAHPQRLWSEQQKLFLYRTHPPKPIRLHHLPDFYSSILALSLSDPANHIHLVLHRTLLQRSQRILQLPDPLTDAPLHLFARLRITDAHGLLKRIF